MFQLESKTKSVLASQTPKGRVVCIYPPGGRVAGFSQEMNQIHVDNKDDLFDVNVGIKDWSTPSVIMILNCTINKHNSQFSTNIIMIINEQPFSDCRYWAIIYF